MKIDVRGATPLDCDEVARLLTANGLATTDVFHPDAFYWIARDRDLAVGCCGLEVDGRYGLVRSVAVADSHRGLGIGKALLSRCLRFAQARGMQYLYLFSKDAGDYFLHLGWQAVAVPTAAAALRRVPQVKRYDRVGWYPDERAFFRSV